MPKLITNLDLALLQMITSCFKMECYIVMKALQVQAAGVATDLCPPRIGLKATSSQLII
jgi:hypothetical protein